MAVATRQSQEGLANALIALDPDSADSFFAQVRRRLDGEKGRLPTVTIDYDRLKVTTQAKLSRDALSSLKNVVLDALKALMGNHAGTEELTILHSLSGQIRPGRFTLLLGPPSSGKSTLLRALAGRLPKEGVSGSIKWNGHDVNEFCAARTVAFVAQVDAHIAMLTARETAAFSHTMQTPPRSVKTSDSSVFVGDQAQQLNAVDAPSKPKGKQTMDSEHVTELEQAISNNTLTASQLDELVDLMLDGTGRIDLIMHMFGLANCADTNVGNEMMRGISGGERKRLSTVEMMMGQQRVCIYDEISTGLDSATLFNVIRWLKAINHHLETTTVISLLQPPPETFVLFDDVMIMAEGRIVFHGVVQDAVPFFHSLGFRLPPRKDVPSYLQEIMTVRGQVAYASPELKRACRVPPDLDESDEEALAEMDLLVSLDDMVSAFAMSRQGAVYKQSLENPYPKMQDGLVPTSSKYALKPWMAFHHVLTRQSKLLIRDQSLVKARIGQCVLMGLVIGLFFNGLDVTQRDARTFLGAMFMAVMFMEFGCMPQTTAVVRNRNVWFKQRASNMYSASSYAWAMSIVQLPLSIFEALLFSVILYFLIGFSLDGAKYFLIFCLTLMLASLSTASLFRLVGCLFRSAPIANAVAGFVMLMLIVNSGFIIVHRDIPPWVIYFYWLSPYAYALRSLAINEMTSPRWEVPSPDPDVPLGIYVLEQFDYYTGRAWIWVGLAYLVFFYILCTQLAAVSLAYMDPPHQQAVIQKKGDTQADYKAARNAKLAAEESAAESQSPDERIRTPPQIQVAMEEGVARTPGSLDVQPGSHTGSSARGHHAVARTLPFTPISVVWRNLSYYVPVAKGISGAAAANVMPQDDPNTEIAGKKRLLDNLTGHARPGVLTALMGGSGAGKTTLMDVLAGRKTQGVITGELLVNGHPKEQDTWSRVVGYVEQTDVHSAGLTVEESLRFSAAMRLSPDIRAAQREGFVLDVLEVVELLEIRDNAVGVPGESGLSVEQRRRLSIGVELVANPSVVFMDEPTSGLDARSAVAVMTAVKNVAANGRTVMVTIHQPSQEIFEAFDALVLLAKGGKSIFFGLLGVQSSLLISYFESIPGVPKIPENYNPATWMLEVSGGGAKMHVDSVDADFPQLYAESDLARRTDITVDEVINSDRSTHSPLTMSSRYAATGPQQLRHLLWKQSLLYWRNPGYNLGRVAGALITGLVFGLTFYGEGKLPTDEPITISNVQNILGSVYSGLAFMGITNLIMGIPAFSAERQVAYRERASSMYAVLPFALSTGIVEIPYIILQTAFFFPIAYFMIGFKREVGPIFLYAIVFTESITLYTFMGQLFTYLMPNAVLAQVLGVLNHMVWQIFNGFLVPRPLMPSGWVWMNWISATTYVVYSLGASQLGDVDDKIVAVGYEGCSRDTLDACPTVEQFMREYFGFKYELRWWCTLILLAFILFFRISAMIVLKVINHQIR